MGLGRATADVAVHIEGGRLSAVLARRRGVGIEVEKWLIAEVPAAVDVADGAAVGAWIWAQLDGAGMGEAARKGGVVFAASRGEVMLKRLTFPPGVTAHEMPGMVRLQMGRHMTGPRDDAGATGVDYVPVEAVGGGGGAGAMLVLAAALPPERMEWRRAVARAAGLSIGRVGLSVEGSAAIVRAMGDGSRGRGAAGSVLGIVPAAGATEIVVVEGGMGGGLAFARSIEVVRPRSEEESSEGAIAALVVEAKRTWMSYRVGTDSADVEAVVVAGTDAFASRLAAEVGGALEIPAACVDWPAAITGPEALTASEKSALSPLVGLLTQRPDEGLNLIEPRKAAPAGEARRRAVLIGALGLVLVVGGAYTWAKRDLGGRRDELAEVRSKQREVDVKHGEFVRARARLDHLKAYLGAKPDWTAHLNRVNQQLPEPPAAVIEDLRVAQVTDVRFELPKDGGKSYFRGKWDVRPVVTIGVAGRVRQRDVADDLRMRLLDDYSVEPRGADVADRFDYLLTLRGAGDAKSGSGKEAKGVKEAAAPASKPSESPKPPASGAGGVGGGT